MENAIYAQIEGMVMTACNGLAVIAAPHAGGQAEDFHVFISNLIGTFWETKAWIPFVAILVTLLLFAWRGFSKFVSGHLKILALIVWFCGFLLYVAGFNEGGCENNSIALATRAGISAIEMFASHSDLIEVKHDLHYNHAYMLAFSIVHFLAVVVSTIFVINLFGLRLRNWGRRIKWEMCNKVLPETRDTYIFWGINEESLVLARQIKEKGRIVFVLDKKEHGEEHDHGSGHHFSFGKLLGLSTERQAEMESIITDLDGYVLRYKRDDSLKRIVSMQKEGEMHVLFLSNDENKNLKNLFFAKGHAAFQDRNVTFHCHAQKSLLNERLAACSGYELADNRLQKKSVGVNHQVRLIDSSYLSVLQLKQAPEAHPVNFVEIETDENGKRTGVVTTPFHALVLGFGDTGQEALSFLYEFSAFVGKDGQRSHYHLVALDRCMDSLQGDYLAQRPALRSNSNLQFVCGDVGTSEYWNMIDGLIAEGLNYVVVALGDDKLNLSVAMKLQEYILRKTNPCARFCIYIKQRKEVDAKIKYLYADGCLRTFGMNEKIFTWEIVFNDEYQKMADKYKERYNAIKKENKYEDRDVTVAEEGKQYEKSSLEKMRDDYRKYTQNLSNAYHKATKIELIGESRIVETDLLKRDAETGLVQLRYNRYPKDVKDYKGSYSYQEKEGASSDPEITALMTTVAKCEHLRWNAAIEMLGYTQNTADRSACNLMAMEHNCLTSWEDLLEIWKELKGKKQYCEYQQYDYGVVETSIMLYWEEKNEIKNDD